MTSPTVSPTLARPTNGLATASLVLGIIAVVGSAIPLLNVGSIILAVLALIFGIIGLSKARKVGVGTGKAIAGLILAIITVIVAIIVSVATAGAVNDALEATPDVTATEIEAGEADEADEAKPEADPADEKAAESDTTPAQDQAVRHAEQYLGTMPFSKSGLITQLTDFESYEKADAEYGVNHVDVDWNEQAAKSAQNYLDTMPFSREELITQLVDFEGFTKEQATYGVDQTGL